MQTDKPGSLSDKFNGFGAAPSDALWNAVEASLDKSETKKRRFVWWWFAGLAAGISLLFLGYRLGYNNGLQTISTINTESNNEIATQQPQSDLSDSINISLHENRIINEDQISSLQTNNNNSVNTNNSDENRILKSERDLNNKEENIKQPENSSSYQLSLMNEPHRINYLPFNQIPFLPNSIHAKTQQIGLAETSTITQTPIIPHTKNGHWEISFFAHHYASEIDMIMAKEDQNLSPSFDALTSENTANNLESFSNNQNELDADLKRPFSINLSAGYHFRNRFFVESGLGFNLIKSSRELNDGVNSIINTNYFSLSIPLNLGYNIVQRDRFEWQIKTGIFNEIPFYEKSVQSNFLSVNFNSQKQFTSGYLFGVTGGSVLSFRILSHLNLGMEIGYRRYFYQQFNSINPVLKKNSWLNLGVGLTYSL